MKIAFRNNDLEHWHIGESTVAQDVFQKLTKHIQCKPAVFFKSINIQSKDYKDILLKKEMELRKQTNQFLINAKDNEFSAIYKIMNTIKATDHLHISNSMPIRYINHLQFMLKCKFVYANRGTSGIDGSTSTAVGIASIKEGTHYIITGDLSFFYDRNGLWNGIDKSRLIIVLMNNNGGGIFDIINGPSNQSIDKKYFTTPQNLNAMHTANDFDLDYYQIANTCDLPPILKDIKKNEKKRGTVLEIVSDMSLNTATYKQFLKQMRSLQN